MSIPSGRTKDAKRRAHTCVHISPKAHVFVHQNFAFQCVIRMKLQDSRGVTAPSQVPSHRTHPQPTGCAGMGCWLSAGTCVHAFWLPQHSTCLLHLRNSHTHTHTHTHSARSTHPQEGILLSHPLHRGSVSNCRPCPKLCPAFRFCIFVAVSCFLCQISGCKPGSQFIFRLVLK